MKPANAACAFCKATPCQCLIRVQQMDEAAASVDALDEDGNVTDTIFLSVGDDGMLVPDGSFFARFQRGAS